MKKTSLIAGTVVLALLAGGSWWWTQRDSATDVQYRTGKIERGNVQATVSASGSVNPVTQVSVGTQVSGQIKELLVDFNSVVTAGQLIAQIDPETFEYRVRQSQADLDASRATVLTAQANAAASRASVSKAQVDLAEAERDLARKQTLVDKQFISVAEADRVRALVNTMGESLKVAQAQAAVTEAQIKTAQANVAQREAALAQARVDLTRTRITSPVNGIVIKRAIEKGQTVAASLQSPELFVIAQNLSDMQVDASINESDVGRIRNGQKASFTVDAFPGQTFEGEVRQVRKAAQTVANVVTYVAVVGFSNVGDRLLPGMTANVRIITDTRENVLKVPNAALRVRIAGVEPAAVAASGPRAPASASTGSAGGWSWISPAMAQPAAGSENTSKSVAVKDHPTLATAQKDSKNAAGTLGGGAAAAVAPGASAAAASPAGAGTSGAAPAAAPAQGSGPLVEFRNRLVNDLGLSAAQVEKVDAVFADMRPRYGALRNLPAEERAKARDRITADLRARIGDLLRPEQKIKYAALLAQAGGRQNTRGRIYLLGEDGKPVAYGVRLGITDGSSTELMVAPGSPEAATIKEGAVVITGIASPGAGGAKPSGGPRLPF